MGQYYRHSGEFPLLQTCGIFVGSVVTAAVAGFAYAWASVYIPFIYLNGILTAGFGAAVGALVGTLAQRVHIRSNKIPLVITFLACLAGYYVAWGADFLARINLPAGMSWLTAFHPQLLWGYIRHFYEHGFWTIGHGVGNGKDPISGIALGIFWLLEVATLFGVALYLCYKTSSDETYCEACGVWSTSAKGLAHYERGDAKDLVARLDEGDISVLAGRKLPHPAANNFWQLEAHLCPTCSDHTCLSITDVTIKDDGKGNVNREDKYLVNKLLVTREQFDAIVAAAPRPEPDKSLEEFLKNPTPPA